MWASEKNRKYLELPIGAWQDREIADLRRYCHGHEKDFYVIDSSCAAFAGKCAEEILGRSRASAVTLLDGDRTLAIEGTGRDVLGYSTHVFDGEFYTGYQVWRQNREFQGYPVPDLRRMPVRLNERVWKGIVGDAFLLTSGHERIWSRIAEELHIPFFGGNQMAAETKLYITKRLHRAGKKVTAYGDSMNDYYMLRQTDCGYLVRRPDGSVSGSLKGVDKERLHYV